MDFITIIETQLDDVLTDLTSGTGMFVSSAKTIAYLALVVASFFTFYDKVTLGDNYTYGKFLVKVLLVALGISFYGTFISIINAPLQLISSEVKEMAYTNVNSAHNYFQDYQKGNDAPPPANEKHDERLAKYAGETSFYQDGYNNDITEEEEGGVWTTIKDNTLIGTLVGDPMTKFQAMTTEAILYIINFIGKGAIVVLNVVRTFFLVVLIIFGIFVIPLSVFPTLENTFSQWLTKYINVYLWLPISYILLGIINKLFTYIKVDIYSQLDGAITSGSSSTDILALGSSNMVVALIGLCSFVGFATVPTMSSWLVNATTASMGSKIKGKGQGAMKGAMSKVGATATAGKSKIAGKIAGGFK